MKFYSQPEEGDQIGFKIADDAATYGLYEFEQVGLLTDPGFTYRAPISRTVNGVIGLNNDLTLLSAFNPDPTGTNLLGARRTVGAAGDIYDADSDGDSTMIVGFFDLYNDISSVNIARINSRTGSLLTSYATTVASIIYAVRFAPGDGGSFYIGGEQTLWNGTSIKQFAKVNGDGTLATAFNANVAATGLFNSTSVVTKITVEPDTGRIYVGYTNSTGGGRVARFETDGTLDASWTITSCTNSTGYGRVYIRAITIDLGMERNVYIGGNFETCNTNASRLFAKLDPFGVWEELLAFTGGSDCKAICLQGGSLYPFIFIATDANAVMSYTDDITWGMAGLGVTVVNAATGLVNDYFMDRIATGISSPNYVEGGIYDIQIIENPGAPYGRGGTFVVLGGNFKKFGPYRAENIISFEWFNEFDAPFVVNQITPFYSQKFDTIRFLEGSIVYRLICSRKRPGGAESTQYTTHCLALGRFQTARGMNTTTNYYLDTTSFPYVDKWQINRNIEIGEYKINKSSVSFEFDPLYPAAAQGSISLAIGNLYNPDSNIFYYDGLLIQFTEDGDPGTVKLDMNMKENLAAFLEEWMDTVVYPNLIAATRELGAAGKPGIRDFYYNITIVGNVVTLELNNPLWENWLIAIPDFEEPAIIPNVTDAIEWRSTLAQTYWNTYKKFNLEWQNVSFYYVGLKYGYYSFDSAFYGSTLKLALEDGGPFIPPIAPRIISFIDIVQLLGEIEIFDLDELLADARLALTRSPILQKSIGTQSSTVFNIYSFIGNIEDIAPLSYSITKQKMVPSQTALYIDLANIVKEDLEADITGFLSDTPVMALGENESRWVRVRAQNYNGTATASNPMTLYHVMDGFVTPLELNGTPESIYNFPRILTPHTNIIARGSAPRLYYRNKDVAVIYSLTLEGYDPSGEPEYWYNVIEPNVFVSQNDQYYNSIDVATYLGSSDQVIFGIVYMDELEEIITYNVYDECKYEKYELIFKNKWGVLESISMSKKTTKQLNISGDDYLRSIVDMNGDYDINRHTKKQLNVTGYEEWTLNTPFIPEYMNESIKEAMLSEEIWIRPNGYFQFGELVRTDYAYPAIRMDQSLAYKTNLNDKNIQYTIKVRLSHNEIKNIR
ncbi:hypothetical protein UFOVP639_15 [uncultured Caudovirales phage]|uniref:Uncharacterized protein n=1 Tax=uncultured Caudovirales phage TaxID=2100421 RepID=A0A6J5N1X1_9CAUD|nr:hypothetical protein UFOVP639_15 [uncultured Caudovirales phage]